MNLDDQNSNGLPINSTDVQFPQKHSFKKIILVVVVISIFFAITIIAKLFYYDSFEKPVDILERSWENLLQAESFVAKFSGAENEEIDKFEVVINYHKNSEKLSEIELVIEDLAETENNILKIASRWNEDNLFLLFDYNNSDNLVREMNRSYPQILFLKTYQIMQPVISGDRWLHIPIPLESEENGVEATDQLSEADIEKISESMKDTILIRSYDKSYAVNDKKYHRIMIGLSKEKLLVFFKDLKDYSLDIKLSDINSIIDSIEETDNWDFDLAEILIDKDSGNFYEISFILPDFQEKIDNRSDKSVIFDLFSKLLFDIESDTRNLLNEKKYYNIGEITFTNYNKASNINSPKTMVEFQNVLDVASQEAPQILNFLLSFSMQEDNLLSNHSLNILYSKQFYADGNYSEAIEKAEMALALAENDNEKAEAHFRIGLPNYKLGNVEISRAEYEKALSLNPNHVPSLSSMAAVYMRYYEYEKAITSAKKAISLDSTYAWAYSNLGIAYSETGRVDEAIEETKNAIAITPSVPDFYYNLAGTYFQGGYTDEAIEQYKKTIEINPKFEGAYINLGNLYNAQDETEKANEIYQKGVENIPNSSSLHHDIALGYAKIYNFEFYEKEMKLAIEINNQYTAAYFSLFTFYTQFNRLDDLKVLLGQYLIMTGKSKEELKDEIRATTWISVKDKIFKIIDELI